MFLIQINMFSVQCRESVKQDEIILPCRAIVAFPVESNTHTE